MNVNACMLGILLPCVLACAPLPPAHPAASQGPGERIGHALAFDDITRTVLLFGGVNPAGESLGDTWAWNGRTWRQLAAAGPSPRKWPTMIYDPQLQRTLLFGGRVGQGEAVHSAADTWQWNGSEWTQLSVIGPPGRDHAGMIYDRARNRTVLFGGWSGTAHLGDTWEFHDDAWHFISDSGPMPRAAHAMAYDEAREQVVMFGGRAPHFLGDTWLYGARGWEQAQVHGPPGRAFHGMSFSAATNDVVLFGGRDGPVLFADTWHWDGRAWQRSSARGPAARGIYALAHDRARNELIFHGGGSMPADAWVLHDETWALRGDRWQLRSPSVQEPEGRACHSAAAGPAGIVIWGGAAACGVDVVNDSSVWLWNGATWRAQPGPPIPVREDALLVHDDATGTLTLMGGRRDGTAFNDIWQFDGTSWRELPLVGGPGPIQHGAAAYDPVRRRVVVFGGAVGRTLNDSTYEWDGARWHAFASSGPTPRVGHGMAYSRQDGGVLLYGGFGAEQFRDLWRWDGTRWTLLAADGPTFTEGHVIAEAGVGIFIVGAGTDGAKNIRAWQWRDGAFHAASPAGPPLRVGATATYDRSRQTLLYWGGREQASNGPSASIHEFDGTAWR